MTPSRSHPAPPPPPPPAGTVTVSLSQYESGAAPLRNRIVEELVRARYDRAACFAVRLAFEEAVSNAFRHGARGRPESVITVDYCVTPDIVYLRIVDDGDGFDPDSVPDPTLAENLESNTGRGLLLMRAYMTSVVFNERGNCVTMIRDRRQTGPNR